jgi:acetyl esterase/lipase
VIDWAQGEEGQSRGTNPKLVLGGGDSTGSNMTEAITLRRRDEGKPNIAGQLLLYPESRVPLDTSAAVENNTGYYLECNGIFSFADHYTSKAPNKTFAPSYKYISPGMQSIEYLKNQPPVAVFTAGFDPLRDVGVEYASKLQEAGVDVAWHHFPELTHSFLQMAPWSKDCEAAVTVVAKELKTLAYGGV